MTNNFVQNNYNDDKIISWQYAYLYMSKANKASLILKIKDWIKSYNYEFIEKLQEISLKVKKI